MQDVRETRLSTRLQGLNIKVRTQYNTSGRQDSRYNTSGVSDGKVVMLSMICQQEQVSRLWRIISQENKDNNSKEDTTPLAVKV